MRGSDSWHKNMRGEQNIVVLLEGHVKRHGHAANNLCRRRHSPFIRPDAIFIT